MAVRWNKSGGMPRRGRSLTLRGLFTVLAVLAALALAERLHLLPAGTLESLLGQEEKKPRGGRGHTPAPPPVVARSSDRIDFDRTQALLDGIRVEEERRRGYVREEWPHWIAPDRGCLNAREQVLIRDSRRPATLSRNGCSVLSGDWLDPYTGERFTDPGQVDIDHRVPLEEAYASGGYGWTRERRAAYANDLTDPLTLLASSREANRAKGSKGPEDWLPPKRDGICLYVADWIAVKARWELAMDERERVTVGNILADCRRSAR
ncbi:hypothetical protein J2847_002209 [Azospirillum agricola]|uniref:HNH endonuclease family protein n=1 Tax=Azospirillum agricola TaxID=1720247 RepID=UPI001F2C1331|nr:HNH endonuclease family protein [Azospirillum agricola]MBP2228917.1 hypothetical protein [Azospirillum agricola]